tara:strand:- start:333 stop:734 length:402 start_codon:yes stop_codon:yes gene_type:complete
MSWIIVKTFLKKSFLWLKQHWQIPFLVLWTVVVWVIARRNTSALVEVMEAKRASYKEQVEILRKSHNDEILKRNELIEHYEMTLVKIEEEFEKREEQLSEEQKNNIKEVVVKSKGNSDEIKKKIEEEFGIEFI